MFSKGEEDFNRKRERKELDQRGKLSINRKWIK